MRLTENQYQKLLEDTRQGALHTDGHHCLEATKGRGRNGYTRTRLYSEGKRTQVYRHQVHYEYLNPGTTGVVVQTCGNKLCILPEHLMLQEAPEIEDRGVTERVEKAHSEFVDNRKEFQTLSLHEVAERLKVSEFLVWSWRGC